MWIFTKFGFFSIVEKQKGSTLTVRSRVRADLDRLREQYLPSLGATSTEGGSDYPYRATVERKAFGEALSRIAEDIHYPNFKNEVAKELGYTREHLYSSVWTVMLGAENLNEEHAAPKAKQAPLKQVAKVAKPTPVTRKLRFGGVVVNEHAEVLLFEPKNHFGDYVWTFPKGMPEAGETPEQTALREVNEETGVQAEIVCPIPGEFSGTTSTTAYFLMKVKGRPGKAGGESQAIRWVTFSDAPSLIEKTITLTGRKRDLQILEASERMVKRVPGPRST